MCARFTEDDDGVNETARFRRKDATADTVDTVLPAMNIAAPAKYRGTRFISRQGRIVTRAISILDFIYNRVRVERSIRAAAASPREELSPDMRLFARR